MPNMYVILRKKYTHLAHPVLGFFLSPIKIDKNAIKWEHEQTLKKKNYPGESYIEDVY